MGLIIKYFLSDEDCVVAFSELNCQKEVLFLEIQKLVVFCKYLYKNPEKIKFSKIVII